MKCVDIQYKYKILRYMVKPLPLTPSSLPPPPLQIVPMKKKHDESAWEIDCGNLMSQFVQKYQGTVVTRGQFFAMQYRDENGMCVLRYAGRRGFIHQA